MPTGQLKYTNSLLLDGLGRSYTYDKISIAGVTAPFTLTGELSAASGYYVIVPFGQDPQTSPFADRFSADSYRLSEGDDVFRLLTGIAGKELLGGGGNDILYSAFDANKPAPTLDGGSGNDILWGLSTLRDTMMGGDGDDIIHIAVNGGQGDKVSGGNGNDTFSFEDATSTSTFLGDFQLAHTGPWHDTLDVSVALGKLGFDFDFAQQAFDANAIELRYLNGYTLLLADTDHNGVADNQFAHLKGPYTEADLAPQMVTSATPPNVATEGPDILTGGPEPSFIHGLGGDDVIYGNGGNDDLHGDAGGDFIYGNGGNDELHGDAGDDFLHGGAGDDVLEGGGDKDADSGRDFLYAEAGNDIITGESWAGERDFDGIIDLHSIDAIVFTGKRSDYKVVDFQTDYFEEDDRHITLSDQRAGSVNEGTDTIYGVEQFVFSDMTVFYDDMLPVLKGNTASAAEGTAVGTVIGKLFFDVPFETSDLAINQLSTASEPSTLENAFQILGDGSIVVTGFLDFETKSVYEFIVDISAVPEFTVTVNLTNVTENTTATNGDDRGITALHGNASANTISGLAGHDELFGYAGGDMLNGNDGDDVLDGGTGGDSLQGGNGFDTASYTSAGTELVINLTTPGLNTGDAFGDSYSSIEAVRGSSFFDNITGREAVADTIWGGAGGDTIHGLGGADKLHGEWGDDTLFGDAGADFIDGGTGADRLSGGGNSDRFIFKGSFGDDVVLDFEDGSDKLDLSGYGLTFSDLSITQQSGYVRVIALDDNLHAFASISLIGLIAGQVTSSDFIL
jgi:Ca2+-binding RTX toxin-like protein